MKNVNKKINRRNFSFWICGLRLPICSYYNGVMKVMTCPMKLTNYTKTNHVLFCFFKLRIINLVLNLQSQRYLISKQRIAMSHCGAIFCYQPKKILTLPSPDKKYCTTERERERERERESWLVFMNNSLFCLEFISFEVCTKIMYLWYLKVYISTYKIQGSIRIRTWHTFMMLRDMVHTL